jgi:hypothetical protein
LILAGDYPSPVVLSRTGTGKPARVGFVESEITDWCRRKIAGARSGAKGDAVSAGG